MRLFYAKVGVCLYSSASRLYSSGSMLRRVYKLEKVDVFLYIL